jgi:hypothetical protein
MRDKKKRQSHISLPATADSIGSCRLAANLPSQSSYFCQFLENRIQAWDLRVEGSERDSMDSCSATVTTGPATHVWAELRRRRTATSQPSKAAGERVMRERMWRYEQGVAQAAAKSATNP